MVIDKLNIFPKIAATVDEIFPNCRCWVRGSRLGIKPGGGNKWDFDIVIYQTIYTGKDYRRNIKRMYGMLKPVHDKFLKVQDEFGQPVKIDFFFIENDNIGNEKWVEIKNFRK